MKSNDHIYFLLSLFMMDLLTIKINRKLLLDFLRSKKNKWKMRELHATQTIGSRVTLDYIYPLLKKNKKAFVRYRKLYLMNLYFAVPQYLIILALYFIVGSCTVFLVLSLLAVKIVIYIVIRSNFDGLMASVYRKSY